MVADKKRDPNRSRGGIPIGQSKTTDTFHYKHSKQRAQAVYFKRPAEIERRDDARSQRWTTTPQQRGVEAGTACFSLRGGRL
jgi:hypothetical protein